MELMSMGTFSKHIKDKKMTGSYHHGFMKGKSCLTNLITAFCNEVMGSVEEGRSICAAYFDF